MTSDSRAAANDATADVVDTAAIEDRDRRARKAEAAVEYQRRVVEAAKEGVARLEGKAAKLADHADQAEKDLAEAKKAVKEAEKALTAAEKNVEKVG